jgi:hypothetical protein
MSAKAGKSSAPHCGHLLTNNLFIGISSTPQLFLNFWMATRCDARHTKNLESMAEMKLQQAATKLVSKEEDRAQYRDALPRWSKTNCATAPATCVA